jgi:two-component system, LuxR family, response regulator FixJ
MRTIALDQCGLSAGGAHWLMIHNVIARTVVRVAPIETRRPIVVVVDDDPAVRGSLEFLLELEGFVVRAYASGAELLNAGDLAECSCLVVDQRMPGMSGMELIARLREREVLTPAVLIVSHLNSALRARAAKERVPIVEKPLLGNGLLDLIREACHR